MIEQQYDKRKWHIVQIGSQYALRKINFLGIEKYMSKDANVEWMSISNIKNYCLYGNLESAELRLKLLQKKRKEDDDIINPIFVKQ